MNGSISDNNASRDIIAPRTNGGKESVLEEEADTGDLLRASLCLTLPDKREEQRDGLGLSPSNMLLQS